MILSFTLSIIFTTSAALACSCADWDSASEMLKNADSVVLAIPTEESQPVPATVFGPDFVDMQKTGMKIVRHYKGKYKKFFYLFAEKDTGANCGASFKKNSGLYLVFSFYQNGRYVTTGCDLGVVTPEDDQITRILSEL